ncbi:hypothetical protein KGO95_00460 [Patescibacteria group bacterium]|nr:hypothetical protein [Patescibacteria group bacterium]
MSEPWMVKVIDVIHDDCNRPIWVRIQYIKEGELLHDAVFVRGREQAAVFLERRINGFIPKNRFGRMRKRAFAVIEQARPPEAIQLGLPLDLG